MTSRTDRTLGRPGCVWIACGLFSGGTFAGVVRFPLGKSLLVQSGTLSKALVSWEKVCESLCLKRH